MFNLPKLKPDEILMYLRKSRTDDPALTVLETVAKHEQMLDDFSMQTWGAAIPEKKRFREIVSGETIEARPEIKKILRLIPEAGMYAAYYGTDDEGRARAQALAELIEELVTEENELCGFTEQYADEIEWD